MVARRRKDAWTEAQVDEFMARVPDTPPSTAETYAALRHVFTEARHLLRYPHGDILLRHTKQLHTATTAGGTVPRLVVTTPTLSKERANGRR